MTSNKLFIRKLAGKSLGYPLPGTWNFLRHSGHVISPCLPLVRWSSFKQWRQNVWKHGNIFGSVNGLLHTEQDTSSCGLCKKVCKSITEFAKLAKRIDKVWVNAPQRVVVRDWPYFRRGCCHVVIAPLPLRQQTTPTNHEALFDMFWLCLACKKGFPIFLGIEIKALDPKKVRVCRDVLKIVAINN